MFVWWGTLEFLFFWVWGFPFRRRSWLLQNTCSSEKDFTYLLFSRPLWTSRWQLAPFNLVGLGFEPLFCICRFWFWFLHRFKTFFLLDNSFRDFGVSEPRKLFLTVDYEDITCLPRSKNLGNCFMSNKRIFLGHISTWCLIAASPLTQEMYKLVHCYSKGLLSVFVYSNHKIFWYV